jgi:hypothetical protein
MICVKVLPPFHLTVELAAPHVTLVAAPGFEIALSA